MTHMPNKIFRLLLAAVTAACASSYATAANRVSTHPEATVYKYAAPGGEAFFALALKAGRLHSAKETPSHDHIVLIDTSASQVGEHRTQAFAVVEQFLSALPAKDRVSLFAVDVQCLRLTDGFVVPQGTAVDGALAALNKRFPAGATNLPKAIAAALKSAEANHLTSILYVGDGMSMANLVQSPQMKDMLSELRARRIPVHSYAVGPRTDLQLLGVLAQHTGGLVLFDRGDSKKDDAAAAGRRLAVAVDAPVFYPGEIKISPAVERILPVSSLPIRADRETVLIGKGQLPEQLTIQATARVDGHDVPLRWSVAAEDARNDYTFLKAFWRQAEQSNGLSVSLAGVSLMHRAQEDFDNQVARLVAVGEQAIAARNLDQAEEIGLTIQDIAPDDVRGKAFVGAVERRIAQAQPPKADDDRESLLKNLDDLNQRVTPPTEDQQDRIGAVKRQIEINNQRMQLEVTQAIQASRRIAGTNSEAALQELKRMKGAVDSIADISADVREALNKRLASVIQELSSQRERDKVDSIRRLERMAQLENERRLIEQLVLDEQELEQLVDKVRALMEEGVHGDLDAYEEAEAVSRVAVEREPGNGTAAAVLFNSEAAGHLAKAFALRSQTHDRFLETLYQVELSHMPFPDEPPVRWPPAEIWQALTQRRKKWASVDLHKNSPAEERIQAALSDTTDIEFIETPLKDAMDFLADYHEITIILDEAALTEEGIATDEPINRILSGIKLRSALRIILEPLALTYVIEDEVMKITTLLIAEEKLTTRVYPVGDLVIPITTPLAGGLGQGLGGTGGFGNQQGGGQFGGGQQGGGGFGGGQQGGGGNFFSVPSGKIPMINRHRNRNGKAALKQRGQAADPEVQGILDNILGQKTSRVDASNGQFFAQVKDELPKKSNRLDNETVRSLKKKRGENR